MYGGKGFKKPPLRQGMNNRGYLIFVFANILEMVSNNEKSKILIIISDLERVRYY